MSVLPAFVILLLVSAVLALPFLLFRVASQGGEQLLRIVRLASGAAIALAAFWALAAVVGTSVPSPRVTVPVELVPIHLPAGPTPLGLSASVTGGGFDQVTVTASGLSVLARLALALAPVLTAGTTIAVAVVVLRLARSLGAGDPFALSSSALATAGWVAMVGGTLATWVGNFADWVTSGELFGAMGWTGTGDLSDPAQLGWPGPAGLRFDIPFTPLAAGLALILLAAVFGHGARLRADAEGLV
ncbi:hypothetical protein ATK74_1853 [Propionicimonas paludicola]|uniref:Uncharacterized protein n=1 Tax=Propionicimonas paludicola TaxID=185243 RepID=A0A2A9CT32_9ACTN|nr:hypothetical protein [Propionicimonas paludicola]PFG17286.1 hypothetical protein ATK74_1853 [Propionicimonas paludicola]